MPGLVQAAVINKEDAEIGQTVHLRPHTKVAPPACYRRLAASVVSYARWPMVAVWLPDEKREIDVHRDNIGLHPAGNKAQEKKAGDQAGGGRPDRKIPLMPKVTPIELAENEEQLPLW